MLNHHCVCVFCHSVWQWDKVLLYIICTAQALISIGAGCFSPWKEINLNIVFFSSALLLLYIWWAVEEVTVGLTESIFNHLVCIADLRPQKVDIGGVVPLFCSETGKTHWTLAKYPAILVLNLSILVSDFKLQRDKKNSSGFVNLLQSFARVKSRNKTYRLPTQTVVLVSATQLIVFGAGTKPLNRYYTSTHKPD